MDVEVRDQEMAQVVSPSTTLEKIATGFGFIEGPAWHEDESCLIFSDIPNSCMYRWSASGVLVFRKPSNMGNGNTFDHEWRLLTCEHATSRLTRTELDGTIKVLADKYDGRELNSPNDVVVSRDGTLYFSDPTYGRSEYFGVPREPAQPVRGVYRLDTAGELTRVLDDFEQPNGLCFSPDEKLLYVNDTAREHIRVFQVEEDGSLVGGTVFAEPTGPGDGSPDGMKTDVDGRVYCTGPGGIHVFSREGASLGVIRVPEVAANFTWGGSSRTEMFISASTSLYRVSVQVAGNVR